MDKKEKFEFSSEQDIPLLTRASVLYGDSTSTRTLVLAIPGYGSAIDLILSKHGQEFVIKRIQIFLQELRMRLDVIENESVNIRDEEAFFDLIQTVYENVTRTRSKDKIKRFAKLTSDCLINEGSWDETEAAIRLISDLTDTHINILQIATNLPVFNNKPFEGMQVMRVSDKNDGADIPSLRGALKYLSNAALTMYCSELIAKGLLHDEGIGRLDTGAVELIVPTKLAYWLLDKVGETG